MKISIKSIIDFVQGNSRFLGAQFNFLATHKKEQVLYRAEICKETCFKNRTCEVCGCRVPGRLYSNSSCNGGSKFPDLMLKSDWEKFKKDNDLKFKL